ncbi:hypothetical protein ETB55_21935 [Salmonella enterica subsp. enterica serovar Omuna]|nr:hypothetical protein [Salmonella enterica subsp. enterica serovar Omuna]
MTVKQLISSLRKLPPNAYVVWRDHDNDMDDFNDFVRCAIDGSEDLREHESISGHSVVIISG